MKESDKHSDYKSISEDANNDGKHKDKNEEKAAVVASITTGPLNLSEWDLGKARKNFWLSYLVCIVLSVLLCFVLVYTGFWTESSHPFPANPYSVAMVGHVAFTAFICCWSAYYNNSSFYDAYWSIAPILFSIYWTADAVIIKANYNIPRMVLLVVAVWIWGIRLTRNWYISWPGIHHEDWRILDIKRKFLIDYNLPVVLYWVVGVFLASMGIQTICVGIASYPIYFAIDTFDSSSSAFNWIGVLSFVVCVSAAATSYAADEQMRNWQTKVKPSLPDPSTAIMMTGLWKFSRHPNYFGEICFWWGCYGFSCASRPAEKSQYGICAVGAIAITLLFVFITIPMMEGRSKLRRPNYESHCISTTSMLVPLPRFYLLGKKTTSLQNRVESNDDKQ